MKHKLSASGFSLIELLVSLSIIAIVAGVIVPKFLNIQKQSQAVVAQQLADELNKTYGNWRAAGGTTGSSPYGSDIFSILTSVGGAPSQPIIRSAYPNAQVSDGGTSSSVRISLPAGSVNLDPNAPGNPTNVIPVGGATLVFQPNSNTGGAFTVNSTDPTSVSYNTAPLFTMDLSYNNSSYKANVSMPALWYGRVYQNGVCIAVGYINFACTIPNDGSTGTTYGYEPITKTISRIDYSGKTFSVSTPQGTTSPFTFGP